MKPFFKWISDSPAAMRYVMITAVGAMVYFVLQKLHHRDGVADFRVYYEAANAFLHDDQLYGKAFGVSSGFYKYSPFASVPFIPLAILPYPIASGLYYFIILASFILFSLVLVYYLERHFGFNTNRRGWVLLLITLFLMDHFERELHLGNVNVLLLISAFAVYIFWQRKQYGYSGLVYAAILLFKPHFLILLPYFIWKKEGRILLGTAAGLVIGLFLPVLLKGWSGNMTLLQQWANAMLDHNVALIHSPNTVYGIYSKFILDPLNLEAGNFIIFILLGIVGTLFLWLMIRNKQKAHETPSHFIEFFLLIALIPNLAHTDTEHFMWTWPLIAYTMMMLNYRQIYAKWIYIVLLSLAFIPYCVNSPDIVGRSLMLLFDEGGLMGIANLVIIVVTLTLFSRFERKEEVG